MLRLDTVGRTGELSWSFRRAFLCCLPLLTLVAVLGATAPAAWAGTLHPGVADQLSRLGPNESATVIFMLQDQADIPALNSALKLQRATRQERHRQVIEELQKVAARSQTPLLQELERRKQLGQVESITPYWIANLVVVRATRSAIEELAARPDLEAIEPSYQPELIKPTTAIPSQGEADTRTNSVTPGVRAVRAPEVWSGLGVTGVGALVANMDTGVEGGHGALSTRWRGYNGAHPWQECWHDVLGTNTTFPTDTYGHGTHVMGTITGLNPAAHDTIGVAWGAQWIACNPINQGVGSEFDNDVINCFQWLADPDGNPNTVTDVPDCVQNSWRINEGFGSGYTDCDTRWWTAIDNCEAAGVVVTFSAGNEGPSAQTIGSPSDRATTAFNVFSVGAVDATNYSFPYPIAGFSSRGPTGCNVVPALKIKPEISAPGVSVWSSWPGNSYTYLDGTSMAGPHVAGVVGLMRSANPDVDVDTIKQILMDTARDEGSTGEDNTFGWGMIDAYEAVVRVMTGYGTLAGTVTNASNGGTPVAGASVRLVEINRTFVTNAAGAYSGMAAQGTYTVQVTHPSFTTVTQPGVGLTAGQTTTQNFALVDIGGPTFADPSFPQAVTNPNDPIPVSVQINDYSAIGSASLTWRVNAGPFNTVAMTLQPSGRHQGFIPGQPVGSNIEFYFAATDVVGNSGVDPAGAPGTLYQILVTQAFFVDDVETDRGWVLSQPSDASNGRWVRMDPYGTVDGGTQVEPADDHTPAPGTICFVTGAGSAGGPASGSDVDGGCVTLTSPVLDLSGAQEAILSYWKWFINLNGLGGFLDVHVSNNNGASWVFLEELFNLQSNSWTRSSFDLGNYLPLTNQMRIRFMTCDVGEESLVEAAVDDFLIEGIPNTTAAPDAATAPGTVLFANRPNPFNGSTAIRYRLAATGRAEVSVFDPSGRQVRSLVASEQAAGEHQAIWDGKDDSGRALPAGVYFYELRTDGSTAQRKMLLLR